MPQELKQISRFKRANVLPHTVSHLFLLQLSLFLDNFFQVKRYAIHGHMKTNPEAMVFSGFCACQRTCT